jgi:hypothetical protein
LALTPQSFIFIRGNFWRIVPFGGKGHGFPGEFFDSTQLRMRRKEDINWSFSMI